jgi:hypothetical protein
LLAAEKDGGATLSSACADSGAKASKAIMIQVRRMDAM